MSSLSVVTYALCKKYTNKSLEGLGALKGSPCKVKSVVPTYSAVDPDVIVSNTVTLEWDSNQNPGGSPILHEESFNVVDNGRGIFDIEWNHSDTSYHYYDVTFYDGTTDTFVVPVSSGTLKRQIVPVVPDPNTADDSTFYLVPIPGKPGSYSQYIRVSTGNPSRPWEMLFIGTTDVDLTEYQPRIDDLLIKKTYKNYDPNTVVQKPIAPSVIGALNEHELTIGAQYDYTNSKVANLKTLHKNNLIDAVNEIGDLTKLEFYDTISNKPDNLVDAINLANQDYSLDQDAVVDRTKYVDTLKLHKDSKDGSAIVQIGDDVKIPRVEITQKATPDTADFRTYDMSMAGELKDPGDTSNKPYGSIHIPSIKLKKIDPVTDPSMSAEYYLSIEGGGYSEAVCGAKIQLAKDMVLKSATVEECVEDGVPLSNLVVGDKYLDLCFTLADGSDTHAYVAIKDMMITYEGEKCIKIAYSTEAKAYQVSLLIYDPESNEALVQSDNGLQIKNASTSQYGVVKYAAQDEVLAASVSTIKTVTPYDVYDFVNNSESVKGDLQGLYTDSTSGEIVNDTIIKAINELASTEIEQLTIDPTSENIYEYVLETHPSAGVKDLLGAKIEVPKSILQVKELQTIATPKSHILYYLTQDDIPYHSGLYEFVSPNWIKVSSAEAIEVVEELPTENIGEEHFYLLNNTDIIVNRYDLSQKALNDEYFIDVNGIHKHPAVGPQVDASWSSVLNDWSSWLDDELVENPDGRVYYITHANGTNELIYGYEDFDNVLYYYHNSAWNRVVPPDIITLTMIDDEIIANEIY